MKVTRNYFLPVVTILIIALMSGEYVAKAAVRRSKLYGAAKFHDTGSVDFTNWSDRIENNGGGFAWFNTDIELPRGAKVRKIKLFAYDNSGQDICLTIGKVNIRTAATTYMGEICSNGANTTKPRVFSTTSISPRLIDNKKFVYFLFTKIGPGGVDLGFWGAEVVYVK